MLVALVEVEVEVGLVDDDDDDDTDVEDTGIEDDDWPTGSAPTATSEEVGTTTIALFVVEEDVDAGREETIEVDDPD